MDQDVTQPPHCDCPNPFYVVLHSISSLKKNNTQNKFCRADQADNVIHNLTQFISRIHAYWKKSWLSQVNVGQLMRERQGSKDSNAVVNIGFTTHVGRVAAADNWCIILDQV